MKRLTEEVDVPVDVAAPEKKASPKIRPRCHSAKTHLPTLVGAPKWHK
jgi:hypothetical protein